MSAEQQLKLAKKMIRAGDYDQARAILQQLDHPLADQWLDKLNEMHPPITPSPKLKHDVDLTEKPKTDEPSATATIAVIVVMTIIGALLIGGAFMITQARLNQPEYHLDNTGCGGQNWVNSIDGAFNELYQYSLWDMTYVNGASGELRLDENLRLQQIDNLNTRLNRVKDAPAPDCILGVRDKLIEAYEAQIRATQILQLNNPINAFGLFGKTLRLMKESVIELDTMGVQFVRVDSVAINHLLNPPCPAFEYVTRTMYVDNEFFVILMIDPQIQTMEAFDSFIRDLTQQYYRVLDDPTVPACLWEVRNQFVEMIDAYKSALEALSARDNYGFEVHFERFDTAFDQFYQEIQKLGLDPAQFGASVEVR